MRSHVIIINNKLNLILQTYEWMFWWGENNFSYSDAHFFFSDKVCKIIYFKIHDFQQEFENLDSIFFLKFENIFLHGLICFINKKYLIQWFNNVLFTLIIFRLIFVIICISYLVFLFPKIKFTSSIASDLVLRFFCCCNGRPIFYSASII